MPIEQHCSDMKEKIDRIGQEARETSSDLETHVKVNEIFLNSMNSTMNELLAEVKAQRSNIGDGLMAQQKHIEDKISQCYTDMTRTLKEDYMTRAEALHLRDEAILKQKALCKVEQEQLETKVLAEIDKKVAFARNLVVGVATMGAFIASVVVWLIKTLGNHA